MKENIKRIVNSTKFWTIVCALGIWTQVIYTVVAAKEGAQPVYVTGGNLDANITKTVGITGNVDINNEVDVNISAINGYRNCFYNSYAKHPKDYYRLPVNVN